MRAKGKLRKRVSAVTLTMPLALCAMSPLYAERRAAYTEGWRWADTGAEGGMVGLIHPLEKAGVAVCLAGGPPRAVNGMTLGWHDLCFDGG
jgi:hypothetical protein